MIIKPFKISDYFQAKLANGINLEVWKPPYSVTHYLAFMENCKTYWTMWDNDEIVIIAGWNHLFDGVCEAVLYPTERFVENPVGAIIRVKKSIYDLLGQYRRIQLICRAEEPFLSFASRLGFEQEGTLKGFGYDGTDYAMMAILGERYEEPIPHRIRTRKFML